jgi:low affinity Fe/Cu permease
LIENTAHADNLATQEKLDEIIRALPEASDKKVGLEKLLKGEKQAQE